MGEPIKLEATFEQVVVKANAPTKLVLILGEGSEGVAAELKALEDERLLVSIKPEQAPLPL